MNARTPAQILSAMSWEEKLAQLQIIWRPSLDEATDLARAGIGALFWPGSAEATNALQRAAVQESAHGIPLLIGLDVVHGQFTIFPTPLAQAASFDFHVAVADARVSAGEARSAGVNWTFSPMVDVSRDPRWGRVVEGFGEDARVNSIFAAAKVRGYQGDDLALPGTIAACLKHFVAYGAAEAGRDYNTTDVSRRRLREVYLEPFRAGVDAGAASVMAAFNSLNGTPMHAHRELLTDVLSGEYGFTGVVVGDADGVAQLVPHGIAGDETDAVAAALHAGVDVVMGGSPLVSADGAFLDAADIDADRIDDAVLRILRLKERLGLFENPYVDESASVSEPTPESLDAAEDAAERCTVLLKNDGALLPLANEPKRVLLVGPYASSDDHLGAWVQHFAAQSTRLDSALPARFDQVEWSVADGTDFLEPSADAISEAARLALDADLVIVAVGEPSALSGEASSRSDIRLPGDQERLIHAIADSGTPFIVLVATGRPLVVADWIDRAPSVLLTWHLGTRAPEAIARVLAGDVDPGGRLPMTFPRAVGQVPIYHDNEQTGRPAKTGGSLAATRVDVGLEGPGNLDDSYSSKFLDLELGPQFTFGHGHSYTSFTLSNMQLSRDTITLAELDAGATITVSTTVTNTGDRAGDDVLFALLADPVASVAQPVQRLRGFERVHLERGESATVTFTLAAADLGFWTDRDTYVIEKGTLVVTVTDQTTSDRLTITVE